MKRSSMPRRFVHSMSAMRTSSTERSGMPLRTAMRLAQEVEDADARDLLGVLEAEEEAAGGPLVGGEAVMSSPRKRIAPAVTW